MEAMPRLPMISFQLKQVQKQTSFANFIKRCIATQYGDDPNSFASEMYELDTLRAAATRPGHDLQGLAALKRYFCQLQALACRFPELGERHVDDLAFHWQDLYLMSSSAVHDPTYEMAAVMYNIGALHTNLGAADPRQTPDGMKMSCTHFQCAAWAFQYVQEKLSQPIGTDLNRGMMQFHIDIALAQAQECILEKSMVDNRKGIITAKVAAQVADYHRAARRCLENALKNGEYLSENVGDRKMKQWVEHVELKAPLFDAVSLLYRGMQSEEQQRMGERIAFYQAAVERLQEAAGVAKRISGAEGKLVSECLTFNMDVVGGKLNNAKKENEFIYHEKVPPIESLPDIKGASLVRGIPFDLTDKDVAGPDIFQKLIPMEAHEHASLYSAKKDELLRTLMAQVDEKDQELLVFLSSLQLQQLELVTPFLAGNSSNIQLPQELVDCAASLHARPGAVGQLSELMSRLSGLAVDLQDSLDELETLLKEEDDKQKVHTALVGGRRPPSMITAELRREFAKYRDAHGHAAESDSALQRAISAHLPNLNLLAGPLEALQSQLPSLLPVTQEPESATVIADLQRIVDKVEQMRRQRSMLCRQMRDAVHGDDITRKVVTRGGDSIDQFIERELEKHRKQAAVIEQNLAAQDNILRALTEANAAYAPTRQLVGDVIAQREARITDLLTSYRALDELLDKGKQGVQFYNKLQENVSKLLTRARGVCKVQDEERGSSLPSAVTSSSGSGGSGSNGGPRLRDYLAAGYRAGEQPPRVRPSPLGSEHSGPVCPAAAPASSGYAAQMAQYMGGGQPAASAPRPSEPAGPGSAGYAAHMAQYMSAGHKAPRGPVPVQEARELGPAGYPGHTAPGYQQDQAGAGQRPGQNQAGISSTPPPNQTGAGYSPSRSPANASAENRARADFPAVQSWSDAGYAAARGQSTSGYSAPAGPFSPPGSAAGSSAASAAPEQPAGQYGYSSDPYLAFYGGGGYTSWTPYHTFSRPPGDSRLQPGPSCFLQRPISSLAQTGFSHSHGTSALADSCGAPQPLYTPPRLVASGGAQTAIRSSGIAPYALATGYQAPAAAQQYGAPAASQATRAACGAPASVPNSLAAPQAGQEPYGAVPVPQCSYGSVTAPTQGAYSAGPPTQGVCGAAQPPASAFGPAQVSEGPHGSRRPAQSAYGAAQQAPDAFEAAQSSPGSYRSAHAPPSAYSGGQTTRGPFESAQPAVTAPAGGTTGAVPTAAGQQSASRGSPHRQPAGGERSGQPPPGAGAAFYPARYGQAGSQQTDRPAPGQVHYSAGYGYQYPAAGQQQQYPAATQQQHPPAWQQQHPSASQQQHPAVGQQAYPSTNREQFQTEIQPQLQALQPAIGQQQYQTGNLQPQPAMGQQQYPAGRQQQHPAAGQQQYSAGSQQQQSLTGQQHYPTGNQQQPTVGQQSFTVGGQGHYPPTGQQQQYSTVGQQHLAAVGQQQNRAVMQQRYRVPSQQQYTAAGQAGEQHQQQQYPACVQPYRGAGQQHPPATGGQAAEGAGSQQALNTAQYVLPAPSRSGQPLPPQPSVQQQSSQRQLQTDQPLPPQPSVQQQSSQRQLQTDQPLLPQPSVQQQSSQRQLQTDQSLLQPSIVQPPQQHSGQQPWASSEKPSVLMSQSAHLLAGLDLSAPAAPPSPLPTSAPSPTVQLVSGGAARQSSSASADLLSGGGAAEQSGAAAPLQPRVVTSEAERQRRHQADQERRKLSAGGDPYVDADKLQLFVQDVERLDKFVAGLTKKSLNGPTPLDSKWKELMDQQEVDGRRLKISVARCYPMKNRFQEVLPFDSSLVPVPMVRDDYINASRLPELTASSPALIATQAPLPVTQTDFWCMVWHHQVELVVCLLPDAEIEGQVYWPTERGTVVQHGPLQLTLQSQSPANGRVERIVSLLHGETKMSRVVIHLQFGGWPRAALPSSPAPFVHFVAEVLHYHQQQRSLLRPLVVHCSGGVGRTGVFCLLAAALAEINAGSGLVDPMPVACLLNTARRNCLQDKQHLLFAYQALLYAAQDFLMKRGILTSRATFDNAPGQSHSGHSRHPSEDFLASNKTVCELQARLGALTASGRGTPPSSPSHGAGSTNSLPAAAVPPPPAAPGVATAAVTRDASRPSSAPALSGALACLDPATFQLDPRPEPEQEPAPAPAPAPLDDPLSQLDPLWSLKK